MGMSKAAAGIGGGFCGVPLLLATTGAGAGAGAGVAAGEGESPAAALVTAVAAAAGFTSGMVLLNPAKLVGKKSKVSKTCGEKSKVHLREWDLNSIVDKRKSKGEKSMHPSSGRPRIST